MVECLLKAEQYVLARFCLREVKLGTALHHILAVLDKLLEYPLEAECLRHAIHQHHHVEVEGIFKRRVLVEVVEDLLRLGTLLELHDDARVLGRLVSEAPNTLCFFVAHEVGNAHKEVCLVDAVREACDHDLEVAFFVLNNVGNAAYDHRPLACRVRVK